MELKETAIHKKKLMFYDPRSKDGVYSCNSKMRFSADKNRI